MLALPLKKRAPRTKDSSGRKSQTLGATHPIGANDLCCFAQRECLTNVWRGVQKRRA